MDIFEYDLFDFDVGSVTPSSAPNLVLPGTASPGKALTATAGSHYSDKDVESNGYTRSNSTDHPIGQDNKNSSKTEYSRHTSIRWLLDESPTVKNNEKKKNSDMDTMNNNNNNNVLAKQEPSRPRSGEHHEAKQNTSTQEGLRPDAKPPKRDRSGDSTTPPSAHQRDTEQNQPPRTQSSHGAAKSRERPHSANKNASMRLHAHASPERHATGRGSNERETEALRTSHSDGAYEEREGAVSTLPHSATERNVSFARMRNDPIAELTRVKSMPDTRKNNGESHKDKDEGNAQLLLSTTIIGKIRSTFNPKEKDLSDGDHHRKNHEAGRPSSAKRTTSIIGRLRSSSNRNLSTLGDAEGRQIDEEEEHPSSKRGTSIIEKLGLSSHSILTALQKL
ncbi:HMG box family protein [Strigomonas culicis]|uniref:HMG box family protein n=1 Tax=Strigomonas culicis TaxID=28005 RepID=S9TIF8_9TRYP|nr:HMG box family protein [Strigomonas culicis]|eukprot:EPY16649.1 HMG box family protein [Strigomonas culicis]